MTKKRQHQGLAQFNRATLAELTGMLAEIPGIGQQTAQTRAGQIIHFRQQQPAGKLARWQDLRQIDGFGEQWVNFLQQQYSLQQAASEKQSILRRFEFWGIIIAVITLAVGIIGVLVDWQFFPPLKTAPPPHCTVAYDGCVYLLDTPSLDPSGGKWGRYPCLPHGTEIELAGYDSGTASGFYLVTSYFYDQGPIEITEIEPGGPADQASLIPGDVLLQMDGQPIDDLFEWQKYLLSHVGTPVTLLVERDHQQISLQVIPRQPSFVPYGPKALGLNFTGGKLVGEGGYISANHFYCVEPD